MTVGSALALCAVLLHATVSDSSAGPATIRVLILDDSFKSIPKADDFSRVGNLEGRMLFKGNEYVGKIEVYKNNAGLFVVNELPLEDYVKSVVKSEVGENWPAEALKAQAVTVRTYALYNMMNNRGNLFHVTSSALSQVFRGPNTDPEVEQAVNATRGEILTYEGKPINAMYHSTSGGLTELPEEVFQSPVPYLRSVRTECATSPYFVWERRVPRDELQRALGVKRLDSLEVTAWTKTGRAREITVQAGGRTTVLEAKKLREVLGWKRLPSTWFSVASMGGEVYIFNGKGYGHGIGMCQWSSMEMAQKGASYLEILAVFYPNTVVQLHEN